MSLIINKKILLVLLLFSVFANLDQDNLTILFVLTKDSQKIFFLNYVSESLKYQDCDSYNVFVNLPKQKIEMIIMILFYVEMILKNSSPCLIAIQKIIELFLLWKVG